MDILGLKEKVQGRIILEFQAWASEFISPVWLLSTGWHRHPLVGPGQSWFSHRQTGKNALGYRGPGASLVAQMVRNPPAVQETWVWSLGWKDPLEKGMATHSNILAWRIPWTEEPGELYIVHGVAKSQTGLSKLTDRGAESPGQEFRESWMWYQWGLEWAAVIEVGCWWVICLMLKQQGGWGTVWSRWATETQRCWMSPNTAPRDCTYGARESKAH